MVPKVFEQMKFYCESDLLNEKTKFMPYSTMHWRGISYIAVVLCKHFSGFIETVSMATGFGYRPYALHSTPITAADIAIPATSCVETLVSTVLMPTVCVVWHWAEGTINLCKESERLFQHKGPMHRFKVTRKDGHASCID